MLLNIGLYVIPEAQNLAAMILFEFKASDTSSRVGYRGGTIKNHQKTMSKGGSKGGSTAPYIPLSGALSGRAEA